MEQNRYTLDIPAMTARLLAGKKFILRWCLGAVVAAIVVGFSIPKEYKSGAKIAPEYTTRSSASSLSALMSSMAGGSGSTRDAVYPELYPDIISSIPFITGLFDIPVTVKDGDGDVETNLYDYIINYQKKPWWNAVLSSPFKLVGWCIDLFREEEPEEPMDTPVDNYRLTKKQMRAVVAIKKRLSVLVDKKTYVVTLAVTMQDREIAATVAQSVLEALQSYITGYRTDKSRKTLEYTQTLYEEARDSYFDAQQAYASYMDSHQSVKSLSAKTESERLQNEMNLAYQLYGKLAQQLQAAEAKVQEETPVYTVMQGPSVPLKKYKPSKSSILVVFVFLGICISCSWLLWGKDFVALVKEGREK